jgi:hypothetical protein
MSHLRIQVKFRLLWRIRQAGSKSSFALKGPLRSHAGSTAYAGRSTGGREDDQEDGLVELQGSSQTHATQANRSIRGRRSSSQS